VFSGFLTGQLLIVDVRDGRVLHRLAGHEDEIQTLAWRNFALPVQSAPSVSDTAADSWRQPAVAGFLLASTSKDRTVRVWDIKPDCADLHCQLSLPKSNAFGGGSTAQNRTRPLWFACAWSPSQPTKLLSTGPQGEVFEWDIDQKRVSHTLAPANAHNRIVFSLAVASAPLINTDVALSIGMDRNIVLWDLTSRKSLWSMPSFGAYVYTHCPAPWSPRVFALALGDNMIGIWNTAVVSKKKDVATDQSLISHQVAMIWKGVQAKVVSLCWHPTQEGCLAFGTEDGRVALVDSSTHHISRPSQFRTQVFELGFARPPSTAPLADASKSEQTSMFLFCLCEDGQLFQIGLSDSMQPLLLNLPTANPENAGTGRKIKKTGFSWSADFGLFCIGMSDGSVMMYSAAVSDAGHVDFGLLATLHDQTSTVYRIRFHPRFAESEFRFIAAASADGTVVVYDVSTYLFQQSEVSPLTSHYSIDQVLCINFDFIRLVNTYSGRLFFRSE
jgi:gem associated protein 5